MAGSMRRRGNDSWQLRVHAGRDPATGRKRYVERTFRGNKRQASKALAAIVAEVDQRPGGSFGKGTVAVLCHEWLAHATPSFSPKTVETTRMYIEDPIIPVLGSTQVAKLTPTDLDRFYRQLLEVGRSRGPYAPATIRRVHGIIRRALTQGVRWGWITHNPAIDASPPRVPMKELKPPEPGQVVQLFRLAQESDPELATFIMLAASSGARRGELLALRWSDIDLDRGTLSIERGIVRVGDDLVEQGTKTHQSRRISLDSGTITALRVHHLQATERARLAGFHGHIGELRIQPLSRRLDTLASGLDLSSLPEDLPAGGCHRRSSPRSEALRGHTLADRRSRRAHGRREVGPQEPEHDPQRLLTLRAGDGSTSSGSTWANF